MVKRDKITEFAVVLHDGTREIDRFETLINPERSIPEYISNMTGITNEMVADAPKFYEVARQIVELTEGAVFVAHNARFDYSFIREEFQRLGYTYSRKQLCTVRLAKKVFPEIGKYGLDALIRYFGIQVANRHRAMDDVKATVAVFEKIMACEDSAEGINDLVNLGIKESRLPHSISLERLHGLPEATGVYFFYDMFGQVIYVGKSINIRKRVMQHFAKITNKASKMQQRVHDISYVITGSELAALLLENYEIKLHQPDINRAQRRNAYPYALYCYHDSAGYCTLAIHKKNRIPHDQFEIVGEYPRIASAKGRLRSMVQDFGLCLNKTDRETGPGGCFRHKIGECFGACLGIESPGEYNERVREAISSIKKSVAGSRILIDQGRTPGEKALIAIEDGKYCGFGYIDETTNLRHLDEAFDHIQRYPETPESLKIIEHFISSNKLERVISFSG